jgi:hypothetical protein
MTLVSLRYIFQTIVDIKKGERKQIGRIPALSLHRGGTMFDRIDTKKGRE